MHIEQKDRSAVEAAYKQVIEWPRAKLMDIVETLQIYIKVYDARNNSIVEHQALKRLRELLDIPQPPIPTKE